METGTPLFKQWLQLGISALQPKQSAKPTSKAALVSPCSATHSPSTGDEVGSGALSTWKQVRRRQLQPKQTQNKNPSVQILAKDATAIH